MTLSYFFSDFDVYTAPEDYNDTSTTFIFDSTMQDRCENVPIISDNMIEGRESFFGMLSTSAPRVTLNPDQAEIIIDDGTCKYTRAS